MKKLLPVFFASLFVTSAVSVYAAALNPDTLLQSMVTEILSPLYKAAVGVAFVYFLYGVVKYMHDLRNPQDLNTGKQHLFWGMIGLFIIFSVGGILKVFGDMFGNLGGN